MEGLFKAEQRIAGAGPKRHQMRTCVDSSKEIYWKGRLLFSLHHIHPALLRAGSAPVWREGISPGSLHVALVRGSPQMLPTWEGVVPPYQWSHPTPGTKMSHNSSENNIWYTTHIWHDFPSYATGPCQIKSVELQWCKACISKVRIRPLSIIYNLIIWEAEHFPLSASCPLLISIWFQWEFS